MPALMSAVSAFDGGGPHIARFFPRKGYGLLRNGNNRIKHILIEHSFPQNGEPFGIDSGVKGLSDIAAHVKEGSAVYSFHFAIKLKMVNRSVDNLENEFVNGVGISALLNKLIFYTDIQ